MFNDRITKAVDKASERNRDLFEKIGRPITIYNITRSGYDEYQDPIPSFDEEISTYGEVITSENVDTHTRNLFGIDDNLDAVVITSDEPKVYEGDEADDRMPSRIGIDGTEFTVLGVWDRDDGTIQINCSE